MIVGSSRGMACMSMQSDSVWDWAMSPQQKQNIERDRTGKRIRFKDGGLVFLGIFILISFLSYVGSALIEISERSAASGRKSKPGQPRKAARWSPDFRRRRASPFPAGPPRNRWFSIIDPPFYPALQSSGFPAPIPLQAPVPLGAPSDIWRQRAVRCLSARNTEQAFPLYRCIGQYQW